MKRPSSSDTPHSRAPSSAGQSRPRATDPNAPATAALRNTTSSSSTSSTPSFSGFWSAAKDALLPYLEDFPVTAVLKAVLWLLLLLIAAEVEFGSVFILLSILWLMFSNLSSPGTSRKPNGKSAYSVFNKNCESLEGTLKAEDFDRSIRRGVF